VVKDAIEYSYTLVMFHLLKDISQIENNLLWVKSVRDSIFSWWFNLCLLVIVVGSFGFFLYSSYGSQKEEKAFISFQPNVWNNAVKNVPSIEYGQIPQIETADSLPGFSNRTSSTPF